jgi:hypothetical protein
MGAEGKMKDFLGTDIEVGDSVAAVSPPGGKRVLKRARVLAINDKTATIRFLEDDDKAHPELRIHYTPPNCLVRITRVTIV